MSGMKDCIYYKPVFIQSENAVKPQRRLCWSSVVFVVIEGFDWKAQSV